MRKIMILMILCTTLSASELNRNVNFDSTASFYNNKFQNRRTASGERFDQNKLTAANNLLPLGTKVKVTRILESETLSVEVRINDRTAKKYSHRIDLSKRAAKELRIEGLAPVNVQVI